MTYSYGTFTYVFEDSWSIFRVSESNIFTIWQKVKSYGDGQVVNAYRFRALAVISHGPGHSLFGIMVAVLST